LDKPNCRKWNISSGVWWQKGSRPHRGNWKMQAGVDIPKTRAEIIPWVWGTGKSEAEDKMLVEFGDWVKRSSEVDMPVGRVALARIPVLPTDLVGFDVANDSLLQQVQQAFAPITQQRFENVYSLVKGLK